jgi:hypothetical protein
MLLELAKCDKLKSAFKSEDEKCIQKVGAFSKFRNIDALARWFFAFGFYLGWTWLDWLVSHRNDAVEQS